MKRVVDQIQPDLIHLNTVVRPPSEEWAIPLSQRELEEIKVFLGERASIISEFDRHLPAARTGKEMEEEILRILQRRPLSSADLSKWIGIPQGEIEEYIFPLVEEGKIRPRFFGNSTYYELAENIKES